MLFFHFCIIAVNLRGNVYLYPSTHDNVTTQVTSLNAKTDNFKNRYCDPTQSFYLGHANIYGITFLTEECKFWLTCNTWAAWMTLPRRIIWDQTSFLQSAVGCQYTWISHRCLWMWVVENWNIVHNADYFINMPSHSNDKFLVLIKSKMQICARDIAAGITTFFQSAIRLKSLNINKD